VAELLGCVAEQALVDHHCHGVLVRDTDEGTLESMLNEGSSWPGGSQFDSRAGFAFRRLCPPVLGLPPHAELPDYVLRRAEVGATEVSKRFLTAAGLAALCVDTGFTPEPITSPAELAGLAGATAHEIVRLERVAEDVAAAGVGADGFADAVRSALATRAASAVGVKSIAAYRTGLDLNPERPSDPEVTAAAGRWLAAQARAASPPRIADETLQRFLIWCGVDLGLPVQFHVGYGDSDVDLDRCNPLLLTPLLRAIQPAGVPVMLLHNYPYHREAGYLAQVFPHVYFDAGLATHNLGTRAPALLAEALELAPFGKFLYSSDAFGLPELYYLGAVLFRTALSAFFTAGLQDDLFSERTVVRLTRMFCADNAKRAYQLASQMLSARCNGRMKLLSVNIGQPRLNPWKAVKLTGIDKRSVSGPVMVKTPRAKGLGMVALAGDRVYDVRNHGGPDQAVYAYAREDLDFWAAELGRPLPGGVFGENLTMQGADVNGALIGERWRIGPAVVLEASVPRIPCGTFQGWLAQVGWIKRFTLAARPGSYFRVIEEGEIQAGDDIEIVHRPGHDVTVALTFRALTLEPELLPRLLAADALPRDVKELARRRIA
jgi:uncharacterized protein